MFGIDFSYFKVDRLAPRPFGTVGPHDHVCLFAFGIAGRQVNVELVFVHAQVGGPYFTVVFGQCYRAGMPVGQVVRFVYNQSRGIDE